MGSRIWIATVLTCVNLLLFCVPPASAQDVRTGVEQLASQIAKAAPEGKQIRVAVTDFPNLQEITCDLGRFFAERLTTTLAQNRGFSVVERRRLNQVLGELKFSMSDLVDPAKAKQLGRMVGVEAIIVGTVSDLGNQVDLDARLIDIERNSTLQSATTTIPRDQVVGQMLERGCVAAATGPAGPQPGRPSATAPSQSSPEALRGLRFSHKGFVFELENVEIVGDKVKLAFWYTNRADSHARDGIWGQGVNDTYLVDNLGNRYQYTGDSFNRTRNFPPQVPERIWISFRGFRPGATAVNLVLSWQGGGWAGIPVVIRNIPLPR